MLSPGQTVANFKVLRRIGEGGMGEVYLAEDQKLHRKVAVKILSADYFDDPERQKRFQREAQTAAQISDPHVMAIYDIGTAVDPNSGKNLNYIIMEHVDGVPLMGYLQKYPNDMAVVVRLSEKIASGLAAAHKLNIVHRDIKAANIVVNSEGEPKILDFGLAKPLEPLQWKAKDDSTESITDHLTKVGSIVGTVSYMSPEQARGEEVDTRSDIFSFGVLLYRMVTGKLPFDAPTPVSTLAKILESQQEPPRSFSDKVPEELERIIDKCLQKNPNDRYQDTRDLVVDLRNLRRQYDSGPTESITSAGGPLHPRKQVGRLRHFGWQKRTVLILLAVILLAAVVKRVYETSATKGIPTVQAGEHSLAILTFDNKTRDSTYDWLETGLPEILLTDLAQTEAIDLISRERILDYLHRERGTGPDSYTHTDLADAARALGAVNLLSGSLYKFGDHLRLDARLEQVASGKIILGEKVLGRNVFALVDSLTEKIADRLNISGPKSSTVSVSELTSTSTEAYQLYHQGMELFGLELFEEAIEKFNRALTIDPNFALAYMRIGMANVFQGRPQQGAQYFALAQEYQDRLPVRERSLLEIYSGFWLEQKYDDAWARLESYVNHYPDDKEARSIYGLAIYAFERDTARAFSHFDTALHIDPQYQLALSLYSQIALQAGNIDKAVEYAELVRQYHPESPAAYLELADLYAQQMKINEAINECEIVLSRFPDNSQAIFELCELFIRKRNFEQSRKYVEQIAEKHGQDPYHMGSYYRCLANLADWSGKFRTSLDYRFQVLKQAQLTGDSTIISNEFETIADYYNRFGFLDSALHYSREAYRWANPFQRLDHAIQLVAFDAGTADEARPIFKKALDDFKSRIPSEVWPLAQAVEKLFEAYCAFDTNAIIAAYEKIAQEQDQEASGGVREAAYLRVMSGQYETGKDILQRFVSGRHETTSGYYYPYTQYLLGIANEGLGNTREAIRNYEEMLKYWGSPEIELKEIKDARARLAKLTS